SLIADARGSLGVARLLAPDLWMRIDNEGRRILPSCYRDLTLTTPSDNPKRDSGRDEAPSSGFDELDEAFFSDRDMRRFHPVVFIASLVSPGFGWALRGRMGRALGVNLLLVSVWLVFAA